MEETDDAIPKVGHVFARFPLVICHNGLDSGVVVFHCYC